MFDRRHVVKLLFYTSIGHVSMPTSAIIFFNQFLWIMFLFCHGGLTFSWPTKWEHASVGRNKTSIDLARKNLADLHCKFFMQHQNMKTSSVVKKIHYRPAFVKQIAQCRGRISVRANDSLYYAPELDLRVKSNDHWIFSSASLVQFRASRYIMCLIGPPS